MGPRCSTLAVTYMTRCCRVTACQSDTGKCVHMCLCVCCHVSMCVHGVCLCVCVQISVYVCGIGIFYVVDDLGI